MAGSAEILQRTASRLGIDAAELRPYMDAMLELCAAELDRGECVELMTFGTLCPTEDEDAFRPHRSLFPPAEDEYPGPEELP